MTGGWMTGGGSMTGGCWVAHPLPVTSLLRLVIETSYFVV